VAGEPLFVRYAQGAVGGTGGEDHGAGQVGGAVSGSDLLDLPVQIHGGDVVKEDFCAEAFGLLLHVPHQVRAHDAVGETREVFDLGGVHQFPAGGDRPGNDQWGQDRKSTRLNSSHVSISSAVFCLK